ncbi:MAG: response regulator [Deltaproteobacteria bacterium]|nr:response regulator [Deltaproteobacteria bacterium]
MRDFILVVEDDRSIRDVLKLYFGAKGCPALAVENGEEALALLSGGLVPRVILLDLEMPVLDGVEFLRERARSDALSRIPVVVMSASDGLGRLAGEFGLASLAKPVDLNVLRDALAPFVELAEPRLRPSLRALEA